MGAVTDLDPAVALLAAHRFAGQASPGHDPRPPPADVADLALLPVPFLNM